MRQSMHLEPDAVSYNGVLNACAMNGQVSSSLVAKRYTSHIPILALQAITRSRNIFG